MYDVTIMNKTPKKEIMDILSTYCLVKNPFAFKGMSDSDIVKAAVQKPAFSEMDYFHTLTISMIAPTSMKHRIYAYITESQYIIQEGTTDITAICTATCYDWRIFMKRILRDYINGCADDELFGFISMLCCACRDAVPYLFDSLWDELEKVSNRGSEGGEGGSGGGTGLGVQVWRNSQENQAT